MKKLGRKRGKLNYAVVDEKNKIQKFINIPKFGDNVLKIFATKKIANQYCPKDCGLKVVAVDIKVLITRVKTKKNEQSTTK